ncbi:penicillin-binding protein 2 [Vibrio aestuarianus]|uniref:Peptidoglycan D,D-transpeptidase MrdA n=1 Tax=Vibrio aestuarianus TaxID=28171 RepID=A0A9X4ERC9_9VIBR|nr:penicillin-binding protein 2 [Vibrio aestuarianus]MDE1240862.1 penicillin-binding protein 2 [Vibrio aestuarianus]
MKSKRSRLRDHKLEASLFKNRAVFAFVCIVFLAGLLVLNIYNLQVTQHQYYQTRSNSNRIKIIPLPPTRGLIYDRNGVLLAENVPVFSLELVPEKIKNIPKTIERLREVIDITQEQEERFNKNLKRARRFSSVPLLDNLNDEQVAKFSVNRYKFPGVDVMATLKRHYPYADILTHSLGYVARLNESDLNQLISEGKELNYKATRDIGKIGIERYYEDMLHGKVGYQEVEVNSRGRVIRTLKYVPPIPGQDITLNIDIELQTYIHNLLGGRKGAAVVLDPRDNGVLAMVSSPSYDPNAFIRGISSTTYKALLNDRDRPLVNRATLGTYSPGSTIKPFVAVAALKEGIITPRTKIRSVGAWRVPNSNARAFRDWLKWGHGNVDVTHSIEQSVNTFFYQIAYDMGIDSLSNWMMMFGFGQSTGIDIFEETSANMPTRDWKRSRFNKPWYIGDTIPIGIGQGYWTATPIQIANATSILINDGRKKPIQLLESVSDHNALTAKEPTEFPPIEGVPSNYWELARYGMYLVNHGKKGTSRRVFQNAPYKSAGKSGTSQVFGLAENEEYDAENIPEHLRDLALFTGFAPYDDPQIVVTVILENAGGGSFNSAPIVKKIFDHVLLEPSQ